MRYARQTAEHAGHPEEVARLVARIAAAKKPKLRYTAGRGVRLNLLFKSIMPWNWYERIILSMLKERSS